MGEYQLICSLSSQLNKEMFLLRHGNSEKLSNCKVAIPIVIFLNRNNNGDIQKQ